MNRYTRTRITDTKPEHERYGHAHETLSEEHKGIYFLLKAKCPIVARDLVVEEGALVLAKSDGVYSERQV